MKRETLLLLFFLFSLSWGIGQKSISLDQPNQSIKDTSIQNKGFDFIIGGGAYFGSKYNAGYYNGSSQNENNLNYIFQNKYWRDEINRKMIETYPEISDSVYLGKEIPAMSYNVGVCIALGFSYKFNKHWRLGLQYSFVRLKATGTFALYYNAPLGNNSGYKINQSLVGKEDRSMFDLTVGYLFHPSPIVKPFLELGVQFNFIRVKSFQACFFDNDKNKIVEYDLLNNGNNYVPGTQTMDYNLKYGGPGFGFSVGAGIKLAVTKYISIDPTFYFSASKFGLKGYDNFSFNYAAVIRIVMSDIVFMKN